MLTDLPDGWATDPSHPWAAVYAEHGHPSGTRLSLGHYEDIATWDIEHLIATQYPFSPWNAGETVEERLAAVREQILTGAPEDFGVCDHPDQVLQRWPQLAEDPRPLLVLFRRVYRAHQPPFGGWRWHKWGTYIGTQEPQREYLYDDKHIDGVYLFEILELNPATIHTSAPAVS